MKTLLKGFNLIYHIKHRQTKVVKTGFPQLRVDKQQF